MYYHNRNSLAHPFHAANNHKNIFPAGVKPICDSLERQLLFQSLHYSAQSHFQLFPKIGVKEKQNHYCPIVILKSEFPPFYRFTHGYREERSPLWIVEIWYPYMSRHVEKEQHPTTRGTRLWRFSGANNDEWDSDSRICVCINAMQG